MEYEKAFEGIIDGSHVQAHVCTQYSKDLDFIMVALLVGRAPDEGVMGDSPVYQKAMSAGFGSYEHVSNTLATYAVIAGVPVLSYFGERFPWETLEQTFKRVFPEFT